MEPFRRREAGLLPHRSPWLASRAAVAIRRLESPSRKDPQPLVLPFLLPVPSCRRSPRPLGSRQISPALVQFYHLDPSRIADPMACRQGLVPPHAPKPARKPGSLDTDGSGPWTELS